MKGLPPDEKLRTNYAEECQIHGHGCIKMTSFSETVCLNTSGEVSTVHEAVKVDFVLMFKSGH